MVIGGAEDKVHGRQILRTFFERSGGSNAHIAIIPCASREPVEISRRYRTLFEDMGSSAITVWDIRDRQVGEDPSWKEELEACTGVFMTGGDQLRLCSILADTPLMEQIRLRTQLGEIALAGTSAGAAVMGHHMIAGGGSGEFPNRALVDMSTGMGIIPEVIVDQHFYKRNRLARLMSAISIYPQHIGLGIDEDTCALFEKDGVFHVVGKGTVTVIDPGEITHTNALKVTATDPLNIHNLRVHILGNGDRYDLHKRQVSDS